MRQKSGRVSSQGSVQSMGGQSMQQQQQQQQMLQQQNQGNNPIVGPPPTTKPPTPPQMSQQQRGNMGTLTKAGNTGTLGKNSQYRTPPVVVPPQVPSHYAPGMMGRRQPTQPATTNERPGYSALPMPPSQQIATQLNAPQIGMVSPMPPPPANSFDDRNSMPRKLRKKGVDNYMNGSPCKLYYTDRSMLAFVFGILNDNIQIFYVGECFSLYSLSPTSLI